MKTTLPQLLCLCIVQRPGHVLLGLKKRGFGAGRWNGFGGKVEPGETIVRAAKRELWEEARLTALNLQNCGQLNFTFADSLIPLQVHLFTVTRFTGTPRDTAEMQPRWFSLSAIPYDQMWADDRYWLPAVLAGKKVVGTFHFQDTAILLSHQLDTKEIAPELIHWHKNTSG
ncbi:MAG: 8-oxo-dGTP diphosphatase [Candidatus Andersenbacteria bacterium]